MLIELCAILPRSASLFPPTPGVVPTTQFIYDSSRIASAHIPLTQIQTTGQRDFRRRSSWRPRGPAAGDVTNVAGTYSGNRPVIIARSVTFIRSDSPLAGGGDHGCDERRRRVRRSHSREPSGGGKCVKSSVAGCTVRRRRVWSARVPRVRAQGRRLRLRSFELGILRDVTRFATATRKVGGA